MGIHWNVYLSWVKLANSVIPDQTASWDQAKLS